MENIEELISYLKTRIQSESRYALMGDSSSKLLVDEFKKIVDYLTQIKTKDSVNS